MLNLPLWLTRIQSHSMVPSLRNGQLVCTFRTRRKGLLVRGMVVVVDSRELGCRIIKRVVGLPGEQLWFDGSAVFVDGHLLAEPYATITSAFWGRFHVPVGHYLLLGDNREASCDSRSWLHPYVAQTNIVGRLRNGF